MLAKVASRRRYWVSIQEREWWVLLMTRKQNLHHLSKMGGRVREQIYTVRTVVTDLSHGFNMHDGQKDKPNRRRDGVWESFAYDDELHHFQVESS
jgi:hypothetical protein